ncbi:MAG: hypothetical protein QM605_00480 [Sphingobium sp.]
MNMRSCRFPELGPMPNLTHTATAVAARDAYAMSGLSTGDIDMVQISMNFAHMGPIIMEDLGFAKKGRGIDLYREGRTGRDGDLPTDTNGGWPTIATMGWREPSSRPTSPAPSASPMR